MTEDELKLLQSVIGMITGNGCEKDAIQSVAKLVAPKPSLPRMTISDAWEHYKIHVKATVKESSYSAYAYVLLTSKYARSLEGHTIDEFTWPFMQTWIDSIEEHTKTLKNFMICLFGLVKYARKMKICAVPEKWEEPFSFHVVTKRESRELEEEHVNAIYEKAKGDFSDLGASERQGLLVAVLGLETGLRIGEMSALDVGDIKGGSLKVSKTLQRIYNPETKTTKIIVGTPKTRSSARTLPISQFLQNFLAVFTSGKADDRPLFETSSGAKKEVRGLRLDFQRFLSKMGIPGINIHSLRHTFISRKIREGKNPKAVSAYAGHGDIKITLTTYTHINQKDMMEVTA